MNGRTRALLAGSGLIVLVNALILAGAAYNRSGEADSRLQLSERELSPTYGRSWSLHENDHASLGLVWRILPAQDKEFADYPGVHNFGGTPAWFDENKLQALGLQLPAATGSEQNWRGHRQREVILVLEYDGPTYQQALTRARAAHAEENRLLAANPDKKEFVQRSQTAQKRLESEENENSRLFVIDAGLDAAALRARYAERDRYLLARGRVSAYLQPSADPSRPTRQGSIDRLSIQEISVPVELQPALRAQPDRNNRPRFQATLAVGKRLEPWLLEISADGKRR